MNKNQIFLSCHLHPDCGHYATLTYNPADQSCTMTPRVAPWTIPSTASACLDILTGRGYDGHELTVNYKELIDMFSLDEGSSVTEEEEKEEAEKVFDPKTDSKSVSLSYVDARDVVQIDPSLLLAIDRTTAYYDVKAFEDTVFGEYLLYDFVEDEAMAWDKKELLLSENRQMLKNFTYISPKLQQAIDTYDHLFD